MTTAEAERLALSSYGVSSTATRLSGEKDDNFLLRAERQAFFLKVVHAAEPAEVTSLVTSVLCHVARAAPDFPVQRVIPTTAGHEESRFETEAGEARTARLTSFVEGRLLRSVQPTPAILYDLGLHLARLGKILASFHHPGRGDHFLLWDMQHADRVWPLLEDLKGAKEYELLASNLEHFGSSVQPRLSRLRTQYVHNDLSPDNVVLAEASDEIRGIIDFGDLTETQLVNDLAVAVANHHGDGDDPIAPTLELVRGYTSLMPLEREEVELLFDLARTRLAVSIVIREWRAAQFPENRRYVMRKGSRPVAALEVMSQADSTRIRDRFLLASGIS